ncbi:hypothetical protein EMCRGX_G025990 [Ephydatia muelleri]
MSEGSEKEMSRSEKKDQEKLLYQDVMKYIMERAYRVDAEKNWKRTIRRKAEEFVLEDGQLYTKGDDRRRWVFDEEDQKRVTEACHDDKLGGGHFGRDKTLQKACSRFYWHDMTNDIKEHIKTCDTCQRTNKKLSKASAELHPIPVRSEVWHQVGIDLVGPLTLTRNNNSDISTRELLHEQLFSPQLFRLWRTGANELAFNPAEDDDDFDITGLNSEAGEYALNKDLIVEHWLTHRAYNKEPPLRDFCGGQFVIMNEKLSEEFDHFRKHDINGSFYPVESLQLLDCWFKSSGISIKTIIRYGKRYFLMSAANIDAFCQWVMETRKMYNKDGGVLDSLNLASKPDLNVCASGFINLRPDNCTTNESKVSVNDCDEEKQQSKKTSDEEKPIKKARKVRCRKQWMEVEDVKLYEEHRCILESNKWVDDVLINASQFLLHSQYWPTGISSYNLGL